MSRLLHTLVTGQHVPLERIVVLGGHALQHTCISGDPHLGNFTIRSVEMASGPNSIPYYTYMAFKGCEEDVVILLDVKTDDRRWSRNALYTAMSRARFALYVLCRE